MRRSFIVVGLAWGDEGKGSWVDHLVRRHDIKYVVRFNGGSQAAHHVVTPVGTVHCFAQHGAGSLVPGTSTILSRFMLVEPEAWITEAQVLAGKGKIAPVLVSEAAPIITPMNRILNRMHEVARGAQRHGSCGFGIGLTQADVETIPDQALYARDLGSTQLGAKLRGLYEYKLQQATALMAQHTSASSELMQLFETFKRIDLQHYAELFTYFSERAHVVPEERIAQIVRGNSVVFEGAQGVLLDQHAGFFPHVTRSTCTFENAELILKEAGFSGSVERIGLLRGYGTRHGAGPFVTEDPASTIPVCHNGANEWQGKFRHGWFDAVAARYALKVVGGVNTLAITNLDRLHGQLRLRIATHYTNHDERFVSNDGADIHILPRDQFALRAEGTQMMSRIRPVYQDLEGVDMSSQDGISSYLDVLAEALHHPISAYSDTIGPQKRYR